MRQTEQTARTLEEAIQQGLHLLGVSRDQVEVEVLEEPSGGIFGLGAKQARVRVVVRELDVEGARAFLEGVMKILHLDGVVDITQDENSARIEILGEDLGILIGRHGETLNALQFLTGIVLAREVKGRKASCTLDVEGYRVRREKTLQALAQKMARKASLERRNIALEPMLPHERRIIHMALQNNPYVTTVSQGKEPMRKVVISPKDVKKTGGRGGPFRGDRARGKGRDTRSASNRRWSSPSRQGFGARTKPGLSHEEPPEI